MVIKEAYKDPEFIEAVTQGLRELNIYMDDNTLHKDPTFCEVTLSTALRKYLPANAEHWLNDSWFCCTHSRGDDCPSRSHCCLWGYAYARFGEAIRHETRSPLSACFSECYKCCQPCAKVQAVAQIGRGEHVHFEK